MFCSPWLNATILHFFKYLVRKSEMMRYEAALERLLKVDHILVANSNFALAAWFIGLLECSARAEFGRR